MWGGLSSTTTSVQHPLGWCDGCHRTTAPVCSPHTSYRWREERVIEPIKWMGIIRRPWLTRASGGNLARTPGLHPTLYGKCHGIFNDHRELKVCMEVKWCLWIAWVLFIHIRHNRTKMQIFCFLIVAIIFFSLNSKRFTDKFEVMRIRPSHECTVFCHLYPLVAFPQWPVRARAYSEPGGANSLGPWAHVSTVGQVASRHSCKTYPKHAFTGLHHPYNVPPARGRWMK